MKITLKNTLWILFTTFLITSCDKEGNNPVDPPKDQRLVKSITKDGDIDDKEYKILRFEYDDKGRVINILNEDSDLALSYAYSENTINVIGDDPIHIVLNNSGYISSQIFEDNFIINFTYLNDYIVRQQIDDEETIFYNWTNENINSISEMYHQELNEITKIQYSDIVNNTNCNIDFNYLLNVQVFEDESILHMFGYWGKRSKNLIASVNYERNDISISHISYSYTTDNNGFITRIVETVSNLTKTYTYSYDIEYY